MVNQTRQKNYKEQSMGEQNNRLFPGLKYRPSAPGLKITEV
jgi:hypothetical protein